MGRQSQVSKGQSFNGYDFFSLATAQRYHESMDNISGRDVIHGLPYGNSSLGASIRIDINVSLLISQHQARTGVLSHFRVTAKF